MAGERVSVCRPECGSEFLTLEKLRERFPEARNLAVERYTYPNLLALNFLVLGHLGEYVRAKVVRVPTELLEECSAI